MWLAIAVAVDFCWLGMVVAISFLETPLKFRAPGVTVRIGLGIGRLVFRALNLIELVLAAALTTGVLVGRTTLAQLIWMLIAVGVLVVQFVGLRPLLATRTRAVLSDDAHVSGPQSKAHMVYVLLELVKVAALIGCGVALLMR